MISSFGNSSSWLHEIVLIAASLKSKRRKTWPDVSPPALLRSSSETCLNAVPEQAISKKRVEQWSILRVIENGLNVTFPAPAPLLWLPMFRVCSISNPYSSTSKILAKSAGR